jgi:hypothetical protein
MSRRFKHFLFNSAAVDCFWYGSCMFTLIFQVQCQETALEKNKTEVVEVEEDDCEMWLYSCIETTACVYLHYAIKVH